MPWAGWRTRRPDAARALFAPPPAIRLYDRALACIGDQDHSTRIFLWHDLGSIYELIGDFEAALGAFERSFPLDGWFTPLLVAQAD
mgnify:CR=1 FL=1